jgi:hypothetical protein
MTYADDLKSPLWQQKRLRVFDRAGFKCERCMSRDRQLHAHHKTYLKGCRPWEYDDDLLECLCDACHTDAHADLDELLLVIARMPTHMLPYITQMLLLDGDAHRNNVIQDALDERRDFMRGGA